MGHGSAAGSVPPVNAPLTPHSTRTTPQQDGNKILKDEINFLPSLVVVLKSGLHYNLKCTQALGSDGGQDDVNGVRRVVARRSDGAASA